MAEAKDPHFDPYYKWLGIPKATRPPTHYQLLGLVAGESDAEVIDEAAIRQSTHLRSYQLGPYAADCTRILNEIALAKQTLLHPQKKKAYDQQFAKPAAPPAEPDSIVAAPEPRPRRRPEPVEDDDDFVAPRKKSKKARKKSFWTPGVIAGVAGGGVLSVVVVVGAIVAMTRSTPAQPAQVVQNNVPPVVPPPVKPVDPPVRPVVPIKPIDPPVRPIDPPIKPVNPPKKLDGDPGLDFEGPINLLDFRHINGNWEATDPDDPRVTHQIYYRNMRVPSNFFRLTSLKNGKVIYHAGHANFVEQNDGGSLDWVPEREFNPAGKNVPTRLSFEFDRLVERRPGLVRKYKRVDTVSRYGFIGTAFTAALEDAKIDMHFNGPHDPVGRCMVTLADKKGMAYLTGYGYGDSMRFDIQFDGNLGAPWDKYRKMVLTAAPPLITCEFSGDGVAPVTVPLQRSNGQPLFPELKPKAPDHRGDPGLPGLAGYWQAVDAKDPTLGYQIFYHHPPGEKSWVWLNYLRNGKGTGFAEGLGQYHMMGPDFRFSWSHRRMPDFGVQDRVPTSLRNENNALSEVPFGAPPRKFKRIDPEPYRRFWGKWLAKFAGDSLELAMKPGARPDEPFVGSLTITTAGKATELPAKALRPFGDDLMFDVAWSDAIPAPGEPWDCMRDALVRRHGDDLVVDFITRERMILRTRFKNAAAPAVPDVPIAKKADGPGWVTLGENDFQNVNTVKTTWTWNGNQLLCSGTPTGVCKTKKMYKNFELDVEWRNLKAGGKSGINIWTPTGSLQYLTEPGKLPSGIRIDMDGDVYAHSSILFKPFAPTSPDGKRSLPKKNLTKGVNQWNQYSIRAVGGEIRLSVNGEEVSGGSEAQVAFGPICLISEGSPIEFRSLKIRELP